MNPARISEGDSFAFREGCEINLRRDVEALLPTGGEEFHDLYEECDCEPTRDISPFNDTPLEAAVYFRNPISRDITRHCSDVEHSTFGIFNFGNNKFFIYAEDQRVYARLAQGKILFCLPIYLGDKPQEVEASFEELRRMPRMRAIATQRHYEA